MEQAFLSDLIGKILPFIIPASEIESGVVLVITREIVACNILFPIVDLLSDPDFYNKIIESKAGAAIRDQQMVTQFRAALDKQGSTLSAASFDPPASLTKPRPIKKPEEIISARTNPKQFDLFLKGIGKCSNLLDARRLRSDVAAQIRKTRALTSDRDPQDSVEGGQRVADLLDYIDRLYVAKRKADKRIAELGGSETSNRNSIVGESPIRGQQPRVTLAQILVQPTSISYFMEFMERRRDASKSRSLRVQFWLLVEGLKNPLEDVESDDDEILPPPSRATIATCRSDLSMVWDAYFDTNVLGINSVYLREIREFIEADTFTFSARKLKRVRRALFSAQKDVFLEMEEEDFPHFVKSDLYFKAMADFQPHLEDSPTATSYLVEITEQPRPRAQNERPSPLLAQGSFTVPPTSPLLPSIFSSILTVGLPRVDSAPPQVTVSDTFLAPIELPSRPPSIGSVEGNIIRKRSTTNLSNSLDFLISPAARDGSRSPLFATPLFDDEEESDEELSNTETPTINSEDDYVQVQTIEAISEALSSILATDSRNSTAQSIPRSGQAAEITSKAFSTRSTPRLPINRTPPNRNPSTRPSLDDRRRISLPEDGRLFGEEGDEMGEEDNRIVEPEFNNTIRRASPGDYLPTEIARITATIVKLVNQEAVVERLIRRAELTGTSSELKILVKSRESLKREMRALAFQKTQYESQESENQLTPGRTNVTISGTTVGQADGQNFQLYLVELHQLALDGAVESTGDGSLGSGWIVTRRYSEFVTLHASLKEKYIAARKMELPGKKLVTSFNDSFVENRRIGLEKYLQALVKIPIICQSPELRSFLSQQNISLPPQLDSTLERFPGQSLVRSFYRSITSSIDLFNVSSTTSMMDTIIQSLSQQASASDGATEEDLVSSQILATPPGGVSLELRNEEGLSYFTAPICDLFITLFELKEKNNWLRRQAILIILQQILGGTIERKFRDAIKMITAEDQLINYIQLLKEGLWPNGQLKPSEIPRTEAQKAATRDSANQKLSALMPDVAANLIGRANARQGARRMFAVLQNRRLSKHLVYSILDELVEVIFPELSIADPNRSV